MNFGNKAKSIGHGDRPLISASSSENPNICAAYLRFAFAFEKDALRDKRLAPFRRNSTTWELLLKITEADLNIQQAIRALETDCLGYSSIVRFINVQLQDGRLQAVPGQKRSEKILKPSADVCAAIAELAELHASLSGQLQAWSDNQTDGHA